MIAIKDKSFELDKPGWVAAFMDAHKRKEKKIHYGHKHLGKPNI